MSAKRAPQALSADYHRNGVAGEGFYVVLFRDDDGSTKVAVQFCENDSDGNPQVNMRTAVLQVDKLAAGDIAFASNSWRGDHYAHFVHRAHRAAFALKADAQSVARKAVTP